MNQIFLSIIQFAVSLQLVTSYSCRMLPKQKELINVLKEQTSDVPTPLWVATVSRDGRICSIVTNGENWDSAFLAARPGSAMKAYTSNSFSTSFTTFSSGDLYSITQPGTFAYGANAVLDENTEVLAKARTMVRSWGTKQDPLIGQTLGGFLGLPGGVSLYTADGEVVGAVGIGGASGCMDHLVALRIRKALQLDHVPNPHPLVGYPFCTDDELNLIEEV